MIIRRLLATILTSLFFHTSLYGFNLFSGSNALETQIDSDQGMTCEQDGSLCWAEGNIKVTRGSSVLTCGKLQVSFKKNPATNTNQLRLIKAWHNVKIKDQVKGYDARGDFAEYNPVTRHVRLEGGTFLSHPKLIIKNATLLTFDQLKGIATARGRPVAIRGEYLLQGDEIVAYFQSNAQNQNDLIFDRLATRGDVIVSTPTEIARGQYGSYHEATQSAELWKNVVITRRDGQIYGDRALINTRTGYSQMLDNKAAQQRPRALLIPQKKTLSAAR